MALLLQVKRLIQPPEIYVDFVRCILERHPDIVLDSLFNIFQSFLDKLFQLDL